MNEYEKYIEKRDIDIKNENYEIIDGGLYSFGDFVIIGDNHFNAARYFSECLKESHSFEETILIQRKTEDVFDVQIWSVKDASINNILKET